ncbi:LPD1 domain-containing protein [Ligilactobacillus salivarius]|uniref:LPD1 domain-containing protein n=1 Tax=Ligilactobacillus salivarius TaxID=1624 RepID=UPI001F50CEB7|nr:LPD1 domain-containing protein [Ligilactobacillus salivarius]
MEKITDLMKERYGIKQTGKSLNVTPSDTLYTIFRKTADYIYRNGEWTEEDEKTAIKGMLNQEDYFGGDISNINIEKTTLSDENIGKITDRHNIFKSYPKTSSLFKTNGWKDHVYKVSYTDSSSRNPALWEKSKIIILDPDNKVGTLHKHNYDIYDDNNNLSSELKIGNLNRTIGYDKLCTDILRELKGTDNREQVNALLARITNPENSGKKKAYLFTHDAYYDNEITAEMRKEATNNPDYMIQVNDWQRMNFRYYEQRQLRNQAVDSISDYLEDTYNLTLQMQYEVDIEAQTHAKSWQTKKNINKATLDAMENSSLKQDFKDLELDNDVDIDKFKKLEPEIRETVKFLPQSTNSEKPILRFRKLGNHHATGLFVPFNNTLAVDFRSYESKSEYRPSGVGIESFIHEYGHFLDYNANNSELSKNGQTRQYANRFRHILSMQDEFKEILHQTQHEIQNRVANGLKMSSHFINYYTTPTEVYARAFEVYSSEIGLQNSLLKDRSEYKNSLIYSFFTDDTRKKIVNYFDNKFPDYRQRVQEYNQTLEERTQYKQKVKATNSKSVENAEQQDLNLDLNESNNDKKLETEKQELDNSAKKLVDELKKYK